MDQRVSPLKQERRFAPYATLIAEDILYEYFRNAQIERLLPHLSRVEYGANGYLWVCLGTL